ncbi:MAG TPA: 2'-5' RNA ligase family protein [Stenotrophomonas sp.]|jgi:2'-5' RNA ligase
MHRPYLYLSSADAQLSLGFGESRPRESLFFALMPPPEIAGRAEAMAQSLIARGGRQHRPIAADRLHVTLYFLGHFPGLPATVLENARQVGDRVSTPSFDLSLDRVGGWGGARDRQPCVLTGEGAGVAGVHALHQRLGERLVRQDPGSASQAFTPHMTLFYGPTAPTGESIEPLQWHVDALWLLRSVAGRARYQVEGRWPLP